MIELISRLIVRETELVSLTITTDELYHRRSSLVRDELYYRTSSLVRDKLYYRTSSFYYRTSSL